MLRKAIVSKRRCAAKRETDLSCLYASSRMPSRRDDYGTVRAVVVDENFQEQEQETRRSK